MSSLKWRPGSGDLAAELSSNSERIYKDVFMKVAAYEGIKSIRLQERAYPKIKPGEAIVKVKYCGICGSDMHSYLQGRKGPPGLVLGHEVVGTVVELGKDVKGSKIGDRVVIGPPGSCGECYYCRHGHPSYCLHCMENTIGLSPGVDGGMAEYVRVPIPENMLVKIPDEVSFEDAVLMDTIAVSFHGIRISHFRIGDNVIVSGAGPIGLAAIEFLRIGGARHITVLQRSPVKLQMGLEYGADLGLNPVVEGDALPKKIAALYGGVGADVVFECAGTPEAFQTALGVVKGGGQIMIVGHSNLPSPMIEQHFNRAEIETKGSRVYDKEEIEMCLAFLAQGRFKTTGMVSDIISLDDIVEKGFERLAVDKTLLKVAIAPWG
jgi:threonine dehydrogenase-like Zn-dependent dehydrogenase